MSMSSTYKFYKMNDPSGIEHSKLYRHPPPTNTHGVTHMESSGTHKWATVTVEEALSEKKREVIHLKLYWKSDSHLSGFATFSLCFLPFLAVKLA